MLNIDALLPGVPHEPRRHLAPRSVQSGGDAASMSVAVATLDARGKIIAAGGALVELADESVHGLVALDFADLFTVDDAGSVLLAIDRCLSGIASWLSVRFLNRTHQAPVWLRLEPLVATGTGSTARIGVAVVTGQRSWRPESQVEIPAPFRRAMDDLRAGLAQRQFELYYQPIIDLRRPQIVGVEALLRWQHPQSGLLHPSDFLPIAEAAGLTGEITEYVLSEACAHAARWPGWRVAVNLFPADLRCRSIVDRVADALSATSLPGGRLSLEVTEQSLIEDLGGTLDVLKDLRNLGVRLSLDDFGTGYSSLLYLRDFPVTELKIAREFVAGLTRRGDDPAIVSSVLSLAGTLDLDVIAVGVEAADQLVQLQQLGCGYGQGFLFSSPLSADQVDYLYVDPSTLIARIPSAPAPSAKPVSLSQVAGVRDDAVTATIADLQQQGASLHSIAAALNQSQRRTADGKRWTAPAVAALIHTLTRTGLPTTSRGSTPPLHDRRPR